MRRSRTIRVPDYGTEASPLFEVGTYNRSTMTFHVTEIPAPPEAREVTIRDYPIDPAKDTRETFVGYQFECACPKCGHDVTFLYGKSYSDFVLEDIARQEIAARPHWATHHVIAKILDAYDPGAGAENYKPEGLP